MKILLVFGGALFLCVFGEELLPQPPTAPGAMTRFGFAWDPFRNEKHAPCTSRRNHTEQEQIQLLTRGGGRIDERYRWKIFNIFIDPEYNDIERTAINNAMFTLWKANPCMEYGIWPKGSTPTGDYAHIRKQPTGCHSAVGRQGGRQYVNLQSPGCMSQGTIMHELLHALGFEHEHERPDRDDFITVFMENVTPGMEHNFVKNSASSVTSFGVEYNPKSIMQYDSYSFTKNGQPTMLLKDGGKIADPTELADSDIRQLRAMYNCEKA